MSEGLDFTNDEGLNFTAWENLDAKQIAQELTGLTSRIRKVTALLDKMVYNNDYDNTEKEYRNLYLTDFGDSGFVPLLPLTIVAPSSALSVTLVSVLLYTGAS